MTMGALSSLCRDYGLIGREKSECAFAFLLQDGCVQNSSFNPGTSKVLDA